MLELYNVEMIQEKVNETIKANLMAHNEYDELVKKMIEEEEQLKEIVEEAALKKYISLRITTTEFLLVHGFLTGIAYRKQVSF